MEETVQWLMQPQAAMMAGLFALVVPAAFSAMLAHGDLKSLADRISLNGNDIWIPALVRPCPHQKPLDVNLPRAVTAAAARDQHLEGFCA